MDLFALAARLTLDASGYEEGLSSAEAGFAGFASRLEEGLSSAEQLSAATLSAAQSCEGIGDAAGDSASAVLSELLPAVATAVDSLNEWVPTLTETGAAMLYGLGSGMIAASPEALAPAEQFAETVALTLAAPSQSAPIWGSDLLTGFIGGIYQQLPALRNALSGIAQTVHSYLHFSEPDVGPLSDFHTYAPDMMALFAQGIRDNAGLVTDQIDRAFDFAPGLAQPIAPLLTTPQPSPNSERPINVVFELDGAQKWVYRLNKAEEQRIGLKLSTGGMD